MGTWGTALFANDNASDIREDFKTIARAPWDGARILDYLLQRFPAGTDPRDDDYTDVNLAIADLFWQYGIKHQDAFERAGKIVDDGDDLEAKRILGMAEAELNERRKVLEELRDKWRKPNPKPRLRRMLIAAEPFLFEAGACLVYPTSQGQVINPYVTEKSRTAFDASNPWRQDGWGTAIILRTYRRYDVFARYLVAILDYAGSFKPELAEFRGFNILHASTDDGPAMRAHCVRTSAQQMKRMRVQTAGRMDVYADRIARHFNLDAPPLSLGENDFCDVACRDLDINGNVPVPSPVTKYLR